jgi:hypothetical protein
MTKASVVTLRHYESLVNYMTALPQNQKVKRQVIDKVAVLGFDRTLTVR